MDKPSPAPGRTNPVKGLFGQSLRRSEDLEWDWERALPPPFPSRVGDAAMRKALCVFAVSWVCNALRQPAQHCLQMQINFPHTSASNKLLEPANILFINLKRGCSASLLFVREVLLLINLKWERWDAAAGFLSVFKLIWDRARGASLVVWMGI